MTSVDFKTLKTVKNLSDTGFMALKRLTKNGEQVFKLSNSATKTSYAYVKDGKILRFAARDTDAGLLRSEIQLFQKYNKCGEPFFRYQTGSNAQSGFNVIKDVRSDCRNFPTSEPILHYTQSRVNFDKNHRINDAFFNEVALSENSSLKNEHGINIEFRPEIEEYFVTNRLGHEFTIPSWLPSSKVPKHTHLSDTVNYLRLLG